MLNLNKSIIDHIEVFENILSLQHQLDAAADLVSDALKNNKLIMFCGNGGSASDSQHIAAELVGRFKNNRKALKAISLSADTAALTCISNDFGYENVFSRQVEGLASPGDVLVGITTSGKSINIENALKSAKKLQVNTILLTGENISSVCDYSDISIHVSSSNTARIQEAHIFIGHYLCEKIEHLLGLIND